MLINDIDNNQRYTVMTTFRNLAYALAAALLVCSCGSSKKVSNTGPYGQRMEEEQCITIYKQKPKVRAYGSGSHFKEATALSLAEANARAMMARKIETAVIAATEEIGISLEQYAAGREDSQWVTDQSGQSGSLVQSVAQELVRNTHVIETSRYYGQNNQFTVFVCIEFLGKETDMAKAAEKAMKEKIKAEDRAKIEARHDEFRERIMNKLGL